MARNPNVLLHCLVCSSSFEVVHSLRDSAKYCSRTCKVEAQKGRPSATAGVFRSKSYGACHYKVRRLRGTPQLCEVCGTTSARKYEWANITGNYEEINDYKRMCTSCHNKFDGKISNIRGRQKFEQITGIKID
jgi:hypothetical protein